MAGSISLQLNPLGQHLQEQLLDLCPVTLLVSLEIGVLDCPPSWLVHSQHLLSLHDFHPDEEKSVSLSDGVSSHDDSAA